MKSVRKIEKIMPEINTIPMVSLDSKPAPEPMTSGTTPTTVDTPVMIMGLNLILHAEIKDSYDFFPIDFNWRANSTIRIPFLADIPINIIIPIWLKIFSEFLKINKASKGKIKVNGTESMIINGYLKLSNCAQRTK